MSGRGARVRGRKLEEERRETQLSGERGGGCLLYRHMAAGRRLEGKSPRPAPVAEVLDGSDEDHEVETGWEGERAEKI